MLTFGTGQGYLKAGFLGFNKSGKTHTAMLLACELRKLLGLKTPIAIFDTEATAEYVAKRILAETGLPPIGDKSRALSDLMKLCRECEAGAAEIIIVDSVTHVWREVCAAYLDQVNRARDAARRPRRSRLEFQDWSAIKDRWGEWTEIFLNSRLHIIICGRAGYEWDFEEREDSSGNIHKELVKTGIKMKTETEFGFEPSLLVQMERVQVMEEGRLARPFVHRATVIGDRFDVMDGATRDNPTGEFFLPHLRELVPGAHNTVDTTLKTDMGVDEAGQAAFDRERREREVVLEEIKATIVQAYPGQSAAEKKIKVDLLEHCFGVKSWAAVERKGTERLRGDMATMPEWILSHPAKGGGKDSE